MPYSAACKEKSKADNDPGRLRKKHACAKNFSPDWLDLDSDYVTANEDFDDIPPKFSPDRIAAASVRRADVDRKKLHDRHKLEALAQQLEQPNDWIYENGQWVPTYPFMFDGADLVPLIISRLPAFVNANVVLRINVKPPPTAQNPEPESYISKFGENLNQKYENTTIKIIDMERVNDNHYYPIVRGKREDQGGNGKCLFYSIWHALDKTTDHKTRNIIYQGNIPNNKEEGAAYLREQVVAYQMANS